MAPSNGVGRKFLKILIPMQVTHVIYRNRSLQRYYQDLIFTHLCLFLSCNNEQILALFSLLCAFLDLSLLYLANFMNSKTAAVVEKSPLVSSDLHENTATLRVHARCQRFFFLHQNPKI